MHLPHVWDSNPSSHIHPLSVIHLKLSKYYRQLLRELESKLCAPSWLEARPEPRTRIGEADVQEPGSEAYAHMREGGKLDKRLDKKAF
jgi:hypothetical protein